MIKKNDKIELEIEKLTNCGGLAHSSNFVVFVKNAVPHDILQVEIEKVHKSYAVAKILEIKKPSLYRITPFCPLFNACGACEAQNIEYEYLLKCKEDFVREALNFDVAKIEKSPKIQGYRCKIQYPVSETKNSKRVLAGYYKEKTHDIINIKCCKMQEEIIDKIFEFVRLNWNYGCFAKHNKKGLLKHVVLRCNKNVDEILITFVLNCTEFEDKAGFFDTLAKFFPQIKGILINFNEKETNTILSPVTKLVKGVNFINEKIGEKRYKIGADSFFQVNPYVAQILFDEIKKHIKGDKILDCYGGVGAISSYVAGENSKITLIEINEEATNFARENFELNWVKNFEILKGDAIKILDKTKKFDTIIIDPPRKGCEKEVLEAISASSNKIIYVSCNPQTLARDVEMLKAQGFEIVFAKPFDMFPCTYHVETLCVLERRQA